MILQPLAALSQNEIAYFWLFLLAVLTALGVSFFYNTWMFETEPNPSPYTKLPLRRGSDIHWMTREKVLRYLYDMADYDNRMFDITKSAYCRETGRLFPDALNWYGGIKVDWGFLQKRYPGNYVSWGSLTEAQQLFIKDKHGSLEGFQIEYSSPTPSPMKVQQEYVFIKPGPLYVDIETGILLGWKSVPGTNLEVLIVQKPLEIYIPGIHKKYK